MLLKVCEEVSAVSITSSFALLIVLEVHVVTEKLESKISSLRDAAGRVSSVLGVCGAHINCTDRTHCSATCTTW